MNAPTSPRALQTDDRQTGADPLAAFARRHIGPDAGEQAAMLAAIGVGTRDELLDALLPAGIRRSAPMRLPPAATEAEALAELRQLASRNQVLRSFIGQGYHPSHTPTVILRNVLENPAWYTAYTPYQAEISQGRLEALLNFQTMVSELTGMDIANASMLDEATAAAEAMTLAQRSARSDSDVFLVDSNCHPQVLDVLRTRAEPLGIRLEIAALDALAERLRGPGAAAFGLLVALPGSDGHLPAIAQLRALADAVHAGGGLVVADADILALALIESPGSWGADIACGTTQRFGLPMGAGGPHAGYLACRDALKRSLPGRLVGLSVDAHGNPALRLALQTREQHIRREKATSNICTAQVLPAVIAAMYAVWHGPQGLTAIARRVATLAASFAGAMGAAGLSLRHDRFFDTVAVQAGARAPEVLATARAAGANLRDLGGGAIGVAFDETCTDADVTALLGWFGVAAAPPQPVAGVAPQLGDGWARRSAFLTHPVFNTHHSETEMLRYLRRLADRDLALDRSMIPLGSCTMKLNATSEMIPVTWPEFGQIHPFAPPDQLEGYRLLDAQLGEWLQQATGYAGVSLQPNAGSQGEYAGLLAIRAWHRSRGQAQRDVCLIPESAHGTNPASAQLVGMRVVVVKCDANGAVDLADLEAKCKAHADRLAAIMITYPSTYGVYDREVRRIAEVVKAHGGRVYVDGANLNALVGLASPGEFGGDVSHLNLHKTFCIPHGGGGPGVGPVCVVEDLLPFLPGAPGGATPPQGVGPVSAAPLGNASVLPISWMYIRMMGAEGLRAATETAVLSANYIAARLADHYDIQFSSGAAGIQGGGVAHECILDLRPLKATSGVSAEDVAKRLIDYGFHAPTLSFPVAGTLMVEPTESEPKAELDRFCDAMIAIRGEIARIERGEWPQDDHPLKHAPHTAAACAGDEWTHAYRRSDAAWPLPSLKQDKYWAPVGRVDNVHGDRNLFCSCPPVGPAD